MLFYIFIASPVILYKIIQQVDPGIIMQWTHTPADYYKLRLHKQINMTYHKFMDTYYSKLP